MWTRDILLRTLILLGSLLVGPLPAAADACDQGSIRSAGVATSATAPDVLTVTFEVELESDSFAHAKQVGDAFRERLTALQALLPQGALMTVGYDFGIFKQSRLAWSRGKKLQYQFVVTVSSIPAGDAQAVLVNVVDGALELDSKLTVEEVEATLSADSSQRVRADLLRSAVANARTNASTMAEAASVRLLGVSSVAMAEAAHASAYGIDYDGMNIVGRSYQNIAILRKHFTVDAGIPDIELTGAVVATFCVEPS